MGWCTYPFNTLAVRIAPASMNPGAAPKPFVAYASELIATEGVGSLPARRRLPPPDLHATSRYGSSRRSATPPLRRPTSRSATLASGAGGCAAFISCPVEVCFVRMSNDAAQPAAEQRGYKSVLDAFGRIMGFGAPTAARSSS